MRPKEEKSDRTGGAIHRSYAALLADHGVTLFQGDSRTVMESLKANSADCIVTDPPYGLTAKPPDVPALLKKWKAEEEYCSSPTGYNGMAWDRTVPSPALWRQARKVIKPGSYVVAFAGTKTQQLTAFSLGLAGFEIVDTLAWIYGQGKPHRQYLKPCLEPIILARNPLSEPTYAANGARYGTGLLNLYACRRTVDGVVDAGHGANVLLSHSDGCRLEDEAAVCAAGCQISLMNAQAKGRAQFFGQFAAPQRPVLPELEAILNEEASKSWFSKKPSKAERSAGVAKAGIPPVLVRTRGGRESYRYNDHSTVKPAAEWDSVMRWLVRLVCPAGGVVLDPFNGSGSTGIAAVLEGRRYVGIDLDEPGRYLDLSAARIAEYAQERPASF